MQPRKYQRYVLGVPVIYSWKVGGAVQHDLGLTRDLSLRGAFIFATTLPPSGATLKFKAVLPADGTSVPVVLRGSGQVIRREQHHDQFPAGFAVAAGQRIVLRRGEATR